MGTLSEKLVIYATCAIPLILIGSLLGIIVAPTIRHLLFISPLWSTHVNAKVQEAYIVGSFRTGLKSGSSVGSGSGGPTFRNLKFFIVAQYPYRGKTYTTQTTALYGEDVFLPGSAGGGSDKTYFKTAVARLRQLAPNTAYTFLQSKYSELYREDVERAMAELPAGVLNAEIDLPIVKWVPSWNYYNLPFTDGIKRGPAIAFLVLLIVSLFPTAVFVSLLRTGPPLKEYFFQTWPGWVFGVLAPVLFTIYVFKSDHKPPPPKDLDVTVPSSQIHSS
ncbi:MAG: hypothetical protein ABI036_07555 [Fibrobacteria bacterium]